MITSPAKYSLVKYIVFMAVFSVWGTREQARFSVLHMMINVIVNSVLDLLSPPAGHLEYCCGRSSLWVTCHTPAKPTKRCWSSSLAEAGWILPRAVQGLCEYWQEVHQKETSLDVKVMRGPGRFCLRVNFSLIPCQERMLWRCKNGSSFCGVHFPLCNTMRVA